MDLKDDNITEEVLKKCTKEELIGKVISLQSHVKQLKNLIKKKCLNETKAEPNPKRVRDFNFKKFKLRHIAIKLLYLGNNYNGFCVQEDSQKTIECELFDALIKTKLIINRETSNYHRCGRTDKGVNAFSQVVSLDVRTNLLSGKGIITPDDYQCTDDSISAPNQQEINYTMILNRVLPQDIRVICWAPVLPEFSARFDCKSRTYKYVFPKGDLDIDRMRIACNYLLGEHDFRNLCKMDINNGVINYRRNILETDIKHFENNNSFKNFKDNHHFSQLTNSYSMFELTITGTAFLWHQIRCIVSLLFLVGQHKEEPEIIIKLLDIDNHPMKPQYCMSSELPLILFDCLYNSCDVEEWVYDTNALNDLIRHLQRLWTEQVVKSDVIKLMTFSLHELKYEINSNECEVICSQIDPLCAELKSKTHKTLFERPFCESLEQRLSKSRKRNKKLNSSE